MLPQHHGGHGERKADDGKRARALARVLYDVDECAKQHQPLYGDGRSSVARAVGYLIERGRCLSRLTTSHHTLRLAYRRVSLSSLCVPCCGWRPVSECTPLLLSRRLLFKYTPPPAAGAAPDVARPANRGPAVPPLVSRPTNPTAAPARPAVLPVRSMNRTSSDRAWRATAFFPLRRRTRRRNGAQCAHAPWPARTRSSPRSGTGLRNSTRDARLHDVAAPCRAAPRRAAPDQAGPRRPRRGTVRPLLSHVMLSATRLITGTSIRACVRDAPLRVSSRDTDFRRRAFSLRSLLGVSPSSFFFLPIYHAGIILQ